MNEQNQTVRRALGLVLVAGLSISGLMWLRSQAGGDQLNLLIRGWLFAREGIWIHYGNPTSSGGVAPGSLTSLLVGVPLWIWKHHRAPAVLVLLSHAAAYVLLDRWIRESLSPNARITFAVLYWLNPWRLYFSAFLWNPNYLFFFGAVHAWTAFRQRREPTSLGSFVHWLAIGLALQIHASFLLLAVVSGLLFLRGFLKIHWIGAVAGVAVSGLLLLPWMFTVISDPNLLPVSEGLLGWGLLSLSFLRGLLYWVRYPAGWMSGKMARFDFSSLTGGEINEILAPALTVVLYVVAVPIALAAVHANLWLWRSCFPSWRKRFDESGTPRDWLVGYVRLSFVAALVVFCIAPTTIMSWQAVILFHASILPLVLWTEERIDGRAPAILRRARFACAIAFVVVATALALGSPQYRCGGKGTLQFPLHADHPMMHELGVHQTCPWPIDPRNTWLPDVLRRSR